MQILVSALAVLPWAVAWIAVGARPELAESPWPVAVAAGIPAVAILAWQRKQIVLFAIAFTLAAVAGYTGGQARALANVVDDAWPTIDLTAGPLPDNPPTYVAVTGYFRDQLRLSEYGNVAEGDLPDQTSRADAVLIPFVGSEDDVVALDGAIVVARVAAGPAPAGRQTLQGKLGPLQPGVLGTLVRFTDDASGARGVLLDTLDRPRPKDRFIQLAIAALSAVIAFGCLWFAMARTDPT